MHGCITNNFSLSGQLNTVHKTPLDAEANVNTSFCNMLHYHGIKSNRKTQLGRDLSTFCSAGLTSELDQIVHGLVLLKSENVRRWKKMGLSGQHVQCSATLMF